MPHKLLGLFLVHLAGFGEGGFSVQFLVGVVKEGKALHDIEVNIEIRG